MISETSLNHIMRYIIEIRINFHVETAAELILTVFKKNEVDDGPKKTKRRVDFFQMHVIEDKKLLRASVFCFSISLQIAKLDMKKELRDFHFF